MATGKFVSYIRVSTARQGASGLGLEAQQEAVQRFLHGGSWELLGEFKEVETGKGADALSKRPQLRAALDACQNNGATLLIAKLDRLARNVHFVSGLMESKVRFVACDMPEANELTIHIMAAFAEHEAKRISQRTKDALAIAKARGAVLGKSGAANLRPNIEARQQAANAFAARLQPMFDGMKLRQLTQRAMVAELNAIGIPAPKGGQWRIGQVQRVLARIAPTP
ncbi:recombinase family protein [Laribacter hongkongensis]|uniref:recombinase family protein n=1 Tax=Laribacter hongkongensis TaxID=168471 RepID=UPI001EFCF9EC|nr:recombinase family protein [Laribacter hongkongensis]MCG9055999.1 recombinase family protein [Laribacter hongkongensis]